MKKSFCFLLVLLMICCIFSGCEYTKDGDDGYNPKGEYVLPASDNTKSGTVPHAVALLLDQGQVIRDYYEMNADAIGAEEAYCIRTNGVNVEFYRFAEDHVLLQKTKELGAYPILDQEGNVLSTKQAVVNGNIIMMIPTNTNDHAQDVTDLNNKLINRFKELKI